MVVLLLLLVSNMAIRLAWALLLSTQQYQQIVRKKFISEVCRLGTR